MGGVNSSPDYIREMGIGEYPSGRVTDEVHQGGIVSIVRFKQTSGDATVIILNDKSFSF